MSHPALRIWDDDHAVPGTRGPAVGYRIIGDHTFEVTVWESGEFAALPATRRAEMGTVQRIGRVWLDIQPVPPGPAPPG